MGVALKHQHSQEDAEDQDDEEDRDRNEEQNLRNHPEVGSNAGETEEARNERHEKEDDGPLDHERAPLRNRDAITRIMLELSRTTNDPYSRYVCLFTGEERLSGRPSAAPMLQSCSVVVRVYQ